MDRLTLIVESIQLGPVRSYIENGQTVTTGIDKRPVSGAVKIGPLGLEGDEIADSRVHGGEDQAVYLYSREDYRWWSQELNRELRPGTFGENLTVDRFPVEEPRIGDRLEFEDLLLEVTAPRVPCAKLAHRMGLPDFAKRFIQAVRPGLYTRVLRPGSLEAGARARYLPAGNQAVASGIYDLWYRTEIRPEEARPYLEAPLAIRFRKRLENRLR